MSHGEAGESFATSILGVHERHNFILAAPKRADGAFVPVLEGRTWLFRTLYYTTALRFTASVLRVAFEPKPHVHVEMPQTVERRTVRRAGRVPVALHVSLATPHPVSAFAIDMSLGVARVAVNESIVLAAGQGVVCATTLFIHDRFYALELRASVVARDADSPEHAGVAIYRLQFEGVSDLAQLTLQAYLSTKLVEELDTFWRLVVDPSRVERIQRARA